MADPAVAGGAVGGHERQAAEQNVEALLRQPISVGSMERLIDALL